MPFKSSSALSWVGTLDTIAHRNLLKLGRAAGAVAVYAPLIVARDDIGARRR